MIMGEVIQFKNEEQVRAEDLAYLREHTPEYLVKDLDLFVSRVSSTIEKMNTELVREFAGVVRSNPPIGWVKISFVNQADLIGFIKRI
jgi:hypothetical protein